MSSYWGMMDEQRKHLHEMIDNQIEDLKTHEEKLRQLIQKWRDEAKKADKEAEHEFNDYEKEYYETLSQSLEKCANELELLL